jgi:hypothetical protein
MTTNKTITQSPFIGASTIPAPTLQQTFNSSTNWTVPNTVSGIWIHLVGGGAGGAGKNNTVTNSGVGGAGGVGHLAYTPVIPGSTVGITIGAGGSGGSSGVSANARYGNDGGETYVNTSGASYGAGPGRVTGPPDTSNGTSGASFSGPFIGLTRQQIVFGSASQSPRRFVLIGDTTGQEGGDFGGTGSANFNYSSHTRLQGVGGSSTYGGGGGGHGCALNGANLGGGAGGAQNLTLYTGGAGNNAGVSGGGGGGAGIAGNGTAASGNNGGAGGAGGGGGGGAGSTVANNNANGGAGGAGCVKIYY